MSLALSIHAPWAWAILHAGKDIENRSWFPPKKLIGQRFWVHASKWGTFDDLYDEFFQINDCAGRKVAPPIEDVKKLKGHIIGSVRLVGAIARAGDVEFVSPWFFGPVGLVLSDPRPLATPVPCKGRLGFFAAPAEVEIALGAVGDGR